MNKIFLKCALFCLAAFCFGQAGAQEQTMTLDQAIQLAREKSPDYRLAVNQAEASYWRYRNYQARFLPQLYLSSTLPEYSNANIKVTKSDGSETFERQNRAFYRVDLGLRQNVPFTGGTFSVTSNLRRIDLYSDDTRQYSATPFSISYRQNSLFYNPFRWQKKIQPLLYEESKREFVESMEQVSLETIRQYFGLLSAQVQMKIAEINQANTDTLYKISKGRYNLGKIAENDLLQMELSLLNARNAMSNAKLGYQIAEQNLIRYLGLPKNTAMQLHIPEDTLFFQVDVDKALQEAGENRKAVIEFRRRRLQAEENLAEARGENGLSFSLDANLGISQNGPTIDDVYTDLNNQQSVALTLSIPLLDWGVAKSQKRMASANLELVKENINRDMLAFEQEIYQQTARWNLQQGLLSTAAKARETAIKRYAITKQRYLIGKITITDLNLAQQEKDRAIDTYINALQRYWTSYFSIRRLTLYDFENNEAITVKLQSFD